MDKEKENEFFGRDTVPADDIPADFDSETDSDIPDYLRETTDITPEVPVFPKTRKPPEIVPTHVGVLETDDLIETDDLLDTDDSVSEERLEETLIEERKRKAEEIRERRAVEKAVKNAEKAEKREITKRRRAKKLLEGVRNADLPIGGFERLLQGGFLLLLERGHYWIAFLLLIFSAIVWYGKVKVGEGTIIEAVRNTGIKELEEVFIKISQTIKNQ